MKRCCRKYAFTIIEVLVALALMAIVASGLVLGVTRSLRATQLKTSKERIERMFLQAFRFAAVSGHVGDVVIRREEDGAFEGYVNLWEIDSRRLSILAQKCVSIGRLSGIESISLNNCSVYRATFRFFGGHGLSTVYAYDQYKHELLPSDFGFSPENITHKKRELEMTLRPTKDPTPSEKISLQPYLLSIPHYLPFPDECLVSGL
jgi:prepilin-type N-terminal cleavage/methylation domain-containing protein